MESSFEPVPWNSIVQHFNSHHVEIPLLSDIKRRLRQHRCIILEGCVGIGKTHCAVLVTHDFANAERIAFITDPSQWENHHDKSCIILDNVDLSCQKWRYVVQDACDPNKKRSVIVTLNSKSSYAMKTVELHRCPLQWSLDDRKKLWFRYNYREPFQDLHDERMGFPLFCSLFGRWGVDYTTEFNPEQYFEQVMRKIVRKDFEEFCRICAVAMAAGESDTLALNLSERKHVLMNNILCLRNMRKIPRDSIQSDSIFQPEEEIVKHLKWMSLSSENHLRLPALKWLLAHDPGLLLDSINVTALVTFAKLGEVIKHERRLVIDQSYYPAIVQRIACGLCDIDQDILGKCPLLKDSEFLSMLFTQFHIMSSSLKPCDQPTGKFERESLTFKLISNSNGFEKFFRSLLTWKNDREMLKLKSTLQFYLEGNEGDEFPSIFTSKLDSYRDWKDIESKLFAVENWDFANKNCLCYASQHFPRYDYHVSLIRKLVGKLTEVEKQIDDECNMVEDDAIWSFPLIMARGIVSKDNLDLLSREHHHGEEAIEHAEFERKLKNDSPLCIVCFTNTESRHAASEEVRKLRKALPDLSKHDISLIVLLVTDPEYKMLSEELSVKNVEIIQVANRKEDVREAVTSLLEEKLLCFIEKLTKTRKTLTKNRSLLVQKDAICKRLNRRKYMPRKRKAVSKPSKVIPKMMRLILDEYKQSIVSYGFWSDKFQIHIKEETNRETIDCIGKKLENLHNTGEFTWEIEMLSAAGELEVEPHYFVKQGDDCFSYRTEQSTANAATMTNEHQGTVGGFAHLRKSAEKEQKDELVVFSCDHLYNPDQSMYVKFHQYPQPVGKCTRNFRPRDLSLVLITRKLYDNFDKDFRNSEDEVSSARIYDCDADELTDEIVHKKGATTGWTSGIVKGVRHVNDQTISYTVFLIEGIDTPFSMRGDSAAYVIRNGDDPDLKMIEIIGVLRGKWIPPPPPRTLTVYGSKKPTKTEELLYEREKEDESDLIVCEDLKSLFHQENLNVTFR